MELFDIFLLIIIGGFALFGLWFGLVHTLGSLLGTILGAVLASRYYQPLADWLVGITGWDENFSRVLMFVLAFIVINRLAGFFFWIIEKFLKVFTSLPFIKSLNRLLGLFLGVVEGVITIGLVIYFIERFPLSDRIMEMIATSQVAPYTTKVASVLLPLLPEALKILHSTVDYVENVVL